MQRLEDMDAWLCICGNRPDFDGFYPCDRDGGPVPTGLMYVMPP